MDPIMLQLGPLALRWYGFLIALGVLIGTWVAVGIAPKRGLDPEKLLDMLVYLVVAGIVGARLVYVLTSPSAFFGPGGDPLSALYIWQGGISFHGGVLGIVLAVWLYARAHGLNMWAYLDVMMPTAAFGIIGGRIGNFMNGTDTGGRLTDWPIGFTWPEPGTDTFGAFGRFVFGDNLWASFRGVCILPDETVYNVTQTFCAGDYVRGPVHLTQFYGVVVGVLLIFITFWALSRRRAPGYVFWQFVLWYSVLRSVLEETFRDNPLFWNVYLSEGLNEPGIGLFTLTQLVSVPLVLIALYMLLTLSPADEGRGERAPLEARRR